MAKKQTKHKKTKNEIIDEKIEKFFETILFPVFYVLKLIFKLLAFIFWRNKYSKRYWADRREWRKTKRKLRSKAQNEIIRSTILPLLEKQGFQRLSDSHCWGWERQMQGYVYDLGRLRGNELQKLEIWTQYGYSYFYFRIEVFILNPMVKEISELSSYAFVIFFPESNYPCVQNQLKDYKVKAFRSENGLKKRVKKLKQRLCKDFSDIDKLYSKWRKNITPIVIDLLQKKKEREKEEGQSC